MEDNGQAEANHYSDLVEQISILPSAIAKLYSQFTRLKMNQPSLKGWYGTQEFKDRLDDAVHLIDAGLYERELSGKKWRDLLMRAGEILEWLSYPAINQSNLPLRLLSASAYQLAGYPALSLGLLNKDLGENNESRILGSFLKANFPELISYILDYWEKRFQTKETQTITYNTKIIDETIRALGVIASYMRWGEDTRLEKANNKFIALSKVMVDGTDSYSWLVAKLSAEVIMEFNDNSLRNHTESLSLGSTPIGVEAFQRYLRNNFISGKSIAWSSQIKGIDRLKTDKSFALCTPTGSGKTTIAELAIIQSLFKSDNKSLTELTGVYPIAMYLVPSRALATEVESKLSRVLNNLGSRPIQVTGLYGGTDWGPTDAWVTSDSPTVLICTYEKGEALLRFLGPLFINRLELVVIDEAHAVQFNGDYKTLVTADNRGLRLETLANRLINNSEKRKVIALSAVAEQGNQALSDWISSSLNSAPEITPYKSTRQLIGRLEWYKTGKYEIRYDLLNGNDLSFAEEEDIDNVPFIQNPFDSFPLGYDELPKKYTSKGVDKRQRPLLFWAALQLIKPDDLGNQHSVLISITQNISGYAEDFVYFFEVILKNRIEEMVFNTPSDPPRKSLWEKCLLSCEDYFGKNSDEYKLLEKGIVVHHGNMPGRMARLLIEVIEKRIVFLSLATSTLSEGVNLPFETVLIPTIMRNGKPLNTSEFKNLIGRAGRPGWGTEGRSLIMLESASSDWSVQNVRSAYFSVIQELSESHIDDMGTKKSKSPLAELLKYLATQWEILSGANSIEQFWNWLETTIPSDIIENMNAIDAENSLDTLDGLLLSIIVEYEQRKSEVLTRAELENHLKELWIKMYTYYTNSKNENIWMEKIFYRRGGAIIDHVYQDPSYRRKLYRTSLSPRYGKQLIHQHNDIIAQLKMGDKYAVWSVDEKLSFIFNSVEVITNLEKFKIPNGIGSRTSFKEWKQILHWWLHPSSATSHPKNNEISKWIKFIKQKFEYLFNWGLGSVISLSMDSANEGTLRATTIQEWPNLELPWIVFWLKELIVWGTLDPVAAYFLAHGIDNTRIEAEKRAESYYYDKSSELDEELLNASSIRSWAESQYSSLNKSNLLIAKEMKVEVNDRVLKSSCKQWRVLPINTGDKITWIDAAGYELATGSIPSNWNYQVAHNVDFILNSDKSIILSSDYL
ncbi:DEAD/DEAH box helicase [Paenibacillus sp. GCM10012306]|uniref:DEAD/DEAH box helicase n=1 Tax=Paenibacillus sp. GCM10012306 TaxID=3317342 RepID=UPI00361C9CAE